MELIKNSLQAVDTILIWSIFSLVVFFIFFVCLLWWVVVVDKDYITKMKNIPIEENKSEYNTSLNN